MKKVFAITLMFAMCTLLSQCRKPVFPDINGTNSNGGYEGVTKNISFKPAVENDNDNSKVSAEILSNKNLKYTWENGDILHVYGCAGESDFATTGVYCGQLVYVDDAFKGRLQNVRPEGKLRFYYLGVSKTGTANDGFQMNMSVQDGKLNGDIVKRMVACSNDLPVKDSYNNEKLNSVFSIVFLSFYRFGQSADVIFHGFSKRDVTISNKGVLSYSTTANQTITLTKAGGSNGYDINGQRGTYVMVIPEAAKTNTTYTFAYKGNNEMYRRSTMKQSFSANKIYSAKGCSYELGIGGEGTVSGLFSISSTQKVYFSKGNLQYIPNQTPKWKFADHQYDFMGIGPDPGPEDEYRKGNVTVNGYSSVIYNHISNSDDSPRDLFGWGCTGTKDGSHNTSQSYYQPYHTNYNSTQSTYAYKYGPTATSSTFYDLSGTSDWGSISVLPQNSGSTRWKTLSLDEIVYLLYTRNNNSTYNSSGYMLSGYGTLTLNNGNTVKGFFILPDDYYLKAKEDDPKFAHSTAYDDVEPGGGGSSNLSKNNKWEMTESYLYSCGAVFLPGAGNRSATNWNGAGNTGGACSYYLKNHNNDKYSAKQFFVGNHALDSNNNPIFRLFLNGGGNRDVGRSVRLVTQNSENPTYSTPY